MSNDKLVEETLEINALKVREILYKSIENDFEAYIRKRSKEFEFRTFGLMDEEFNELLERQHKERNEAVKKIMHNEINSFMLRSGFFRDNEEITYLLVHWKDIWLKHTDMFVNLSDS